MKTNRMPANAPITPAQLGMLHVAKAQLSLTDEEYRALLHGLGGVGSAKDLTQEGVRHIINRMQQLGFRPRKSKVIPMRSPNGDGSLPPSPAQQRFLAALFAGAGFKDTQRRRSYCLRVIKKEEAGTKTEANKLIEGLKKMQSRGYKAGGC